MSHHANVPNANPSRPSGHATRAEGTMRGAAPLGQAHEVSRAVDLWEIVARAPEGKIVTIGRAPNPSVGNISVTLTGPLGNPKVSATHATLRWEDAALRFEQLGQNPTRISSREGNELCLTNGAQHTLRAGDVLTFPGGVTLQVPNEPEFAAVALRNLHAHPDRSFEDYDRIGHRIISLRNDSTDIGPSLDALGEVSQAAREWLLSPREPAHVAYLTSLESEPAKSALAQLLRARKFPNTHGNSLDGSNSLGIPGKVSAARIFREEAGEIEAVRAVAPSAARSLPSINPISSTPGSFTAVDDHSRRLTVQRFYDGRTNRPLHICLQQSATSCVWTAKFLLALDAASRHSVAPTDLEHLTSGAFCASLSNLESAKDSLEASFEGTGLSPRVTKGSADPLKLRTQLRNGGPAIVEITSSVGGHVLIIDSVNTKLFRPSATTVSLRDTYHGWAIEVPWAAFLAKWDRGRSLLQISKD